MLDVASLTPLVDAFSTQMLVVCLRWNILYLTNLRDFLA